MHVAVQSLLRQSVRADKIILWLGHEKFPQKEKSLPKELLVLTEKGLTIEWTKDLRSYTKLIPALKKYPRDIIVTVDDDQIYPKDMLNNLLAAHRVAPRDVIAHRIARMRNSFRIFPFRYYYQDAAAAIALDYAEDLKQPSFFNKQTGVCGALYPPNCLHSDVLREELFLRLSPTQDDIWFWLMGVLRETRVSMPSCHFAQMNYVPNTQETALSMVNDTGPKLFFVHLKNTLGHYPQLKEIFAQDKRTNARVLRKLSWAFRFRSLKYRIVSRSIP